MLRENFSSDIDNNQSIENVFIMFGYIVATVIIVSLLYWSYNKNVFLHIIVLSCITFIYSIIMMSLALINRDTFDNTTFKLLFGGSIFIMFFNFFIILLYILKYYQVL
jgi:hypothetical protein